MKKTFVIIAILLLLLGSGAALAVNGYVPITDLYGFPKGEPAVIDYGAKPYVPTEVMLSEPTLPYVVPEDAVQLWLDAENGSDENDGSESSPLATLAAARDAVRLINDDMQSDIVVNLRGTFYLPETLMLDEEDGGTNGHDVVYRSVDGTRAVISGGKVLTGWTLHDAQNNIYAADCDVLTRDFFVNGHRAQRARTAERFMFYSFHPERTARDGQVTTLLEGVEDVEGGFVSTDLSWTELKNQDRIEVVQMTSFNMLRYPLVSITEKDGKAFFRVSENAYKLIQETWAAALGTPDMGPRVYCLENAYEFIDEDGEWYLDDEAGKLYYKAAAGEDPSAEETVVGVLSNLVTSEGKRTKYIQHVRFDSVTFNHSTWLQANRPEGLIGIQAGVYRKADTTAATTWSNDNWLRQNAAVTFNYPKNVSFVNCAFFNIGSAALDLNSGTQYCVVSGCYFDDVAGAGLLLGGLHSSDKELSTRTYTTVRSNDNKVTDNLFLNCACVYYSECAIVRGYTYRTEISHNTISNTPYSAMSLGWGWGGNELQQANIDRFAKMEGFYSGNITACNRIDNCMWLLQDGGAIYSLGRQDEHMILGNYITNSAEIAIYLDNGSAGALVKDNVMINCFRNLNLNGGYDNTFTHNYATLGFSPDNLRVIDEAHTITNTKTVMSDAERDSVIVGAGVRAPYSQYFGLG